MVTWSQLHSSLLFYLLITASLASGSSSTLRAADLNLISALPGGIFSTLCLTNDLKPGTLPCVWRYRVSAGTGWASVSVL